MLDSPPFIIPFLFFQYTASVNLRVKEEHGKAPWEILDPSKYASYKMEEKKGRAGSQSLDFGAVIRPIKTNKINGL